MIVRTLLLFRLNSDVIPLGNSAIRVIRLYLNGVPFFHAEPNAVTSPGVPTSQQRISAIMNFYSTEGPTITQLRNNADDKLFLKIQDNPHHVLYKLLPMESNTGYNLGTRKHPFCLPVEDNRNFINRALCKDII